MKRMNLAAAGLVLGFCVASVVRAEDAVKAPQPFMRASIASTDRVKQAVADLGIPLPIDLAGLIEMQLPFIGAGGIDTSKPLGLMFIAGEGLTMEKMAMFALPANAGK